jgi:hypothetical protein
MNVTFRGNKLTIDGRIATLPHAIEFILPLSDRVIVLLDPEDYADDDATVERNVFAVGRSGEILWQIERAYVPSVRNSDDDFSPFTAIELAKDGKTPRAFEWDGVWYDLSPQTGQLSNALFTR